MTDLVQLRRTVTTAAVLFVADQGCASALATLEDAVADYLEALKAQAPDGRGKPAARASSKT